MSALFSPITLRNLTLRNRIVVSPMCQYSAENGEATAWHMIHLGTLALSGAGLLCIEATAVEADGRITPGCLGLYNDATEAALRPVLAAIRKYSKMPVTMQLAHAGRKASSHRPWDGGQQIPLSQGGWLAHAPSAVPHKEGELPPQALDAAGLKRLREAFVEAAKRAERLGLDALEVHCAHGYLLHEFLSPIANRRTDDYGGSLENRMRFPLEVFDAVRAAFPAAKPVGVRVSGTDWVRRRLGPRADHHLRQRAEDARRRLDRRIVGRRLALAENPDRTRLSGALGARREGIDRPHDDRGRPHHRSAAGRRHCRERQGGSRRAGARHALRSALALARGGAARCERRCAAAILAFGAAWGEGLVRRHRGWGTVTLEFRNAPISLKKYVDGRLWGL